MRDDRAMKEVFGKVYEQESYKVIYQTEEGRFGIYVWADDSDDAKREVTSRIKGAKVESVKLSRPGEGGIK